MTQEPKPAKTPPISEEERARRMERHLQSAANLRLEGLTQSPEAEAISLDWVDGKISDGEALERVRALYIPAKKPSSGD